MRLFLYFAVCIYYFVFAFKKDVFVKVVAILFLLYVLSLGVYTFMVI